MLRLLRSLLGGGAEFYPFESCILEEVKARLSGEGLERFQRQIAAINKIQRLTNGKEVNLYQKRRGKVVFDDRLRFPDAADEAILASASLAGPGRAKLKVEVWLAGGYVFSLAFNKSPKQFYAGVDLRSVRPEIVDVKVWFDPMLPHPGNSEIPFDVSMLTGWLRAWNGRGWVGIMYAPLPAPERAACLARIDAQLPSDYLELVEQAEGGSLKGCKVYGAAGIRQVVFPEANYYFLAEMEGLGALTVKDGDHSGELYFFSYEDDGDPQAMGTSFEKAAAKLLGVYVDADAPSQ